jgi:glyoxylase-like metal-dependent hydrolase (beta-lactamase superfamily II)
VTTTPANGQGFKVGSLDVKGLYTPCHTQDSICWFVEDNGDKAVFTGDTLFHGGKCPRLGTDPGLPNTRAEKTQTDHCYLFS